MDSCPSVFLLLFRMIFREKKEDGNFYGGNGLGCIQNMDLQNMKRVVCAGFKEIDRFQFSEMDKSVFIGV